MRHRVEEDRQRCHQRFTFTRCHFGDLTLMQYHTTKQLDIIMNHVPSYLVTAGYPVVLVHSPTAMYLHKVKPRVSRKVFIHLRGSNFHFLALCETTSRRLNDSIGFRKYLVQYHLVCFFYLFLKFVNFVVNFLALIDIQFLNTGLELSNTGFFVCHAVCHFGHQCRTTRTQFIVTQFVNLLILSLNLIHIRLNSAHILLRFVSE